MSTTKSIVTNGLLGESSLAIASNGFLAVAADLRRRFRGGSGRILRKTEEPEYEKQSSVEFLKDKMAQELLRRRNDEAIILLMV